MRSAMFVAHLILARERARKEEKDGEGETSNTHTCKAKSYSAPIFLFEHVGSHPEEM